MSIMSDKMCAKLVTVALLLVCAQALPLEEQYHQATSFSSFNEHHNTVHHVHSAPAVKTTVALPVHPSPLYVAPLHIAPQASQSSISIGHITPIAKLFTPVAVHSAPVAIHSAHHEEDEHAPAKYEFAYGVEDHHTGDIHSQKESRDGDVTQGEYSLHEADGTIRTVKYTVDKHSGFNAIVQRSGHAAHPQPISHH